MSRRVRVYADWAGWWIWLYRGPHHLYACPVPCLVIRISRRGSSGRPEQEA